MRRVSCPRKLIFERRLCNFERAQTLNLANGGIQRSDRESPWVPDMQVRELSAMNVL
jgi:hypothetical protein